MSSSRIFFSMIPIRLRRNMSNLWYEYLSRVTQDSDLPFLNYGYAHLDTHSKVPNLQGEDAVYRHQVQLYHHVIGSVQLKSLDVLEIGSGRGGGASHVMRYFEPISVTAVDYSSTAIDYCQSHYKIEGLSFVHGNAGNLHLEDDSYDIIINIESSNSYHSMIHFLGEVRRLLKTNGYFLFADIREKETIDRLRRQLRDTGLTLVREENITANVVKALELDNEWKRQYIKRNVPRLIQWPYGEFAAMKGTRMVYQALKSGLKEYISFVLQKSEK